MTRPAGKKGATPGPNHSQNTQTAPNRSPLVKERWSRQAQKAVLHIDGATLVVGEIYRLGCCLLGREKLVSRPLRLLGLGVASLREPNARQLVLL